MNLLALCGCVPGAEISDVANRATLQNFGEIQKLIVQRTYNSGVFNSLTIGVNNPNIKATWSTLIAAADDTKVVTTPYIHGLKNEAGDPIQFGGPGETVGGVAQNIGKNPTSFEGMLYGAWQSTAAALEGWHCESLSVYFINECGDIAGVVDDPVTPTTFRGFPLADSTWYVSDKVMGGKTAPDSNKIQWSFLPNWSSGFGVIDTTDFNPLTDSDFNPVV